MRKVNPTFVGTMIGLLCILLLPGDYVHDERDFFQHMIVFGVTGTIVGRLVKLIAWRRTGHSVTRRTKT